MQNVVTINLSQFTAMELANLMLAAQSKKMTVEEYITFLLQGVAAPKK